MGVIPDIATLAILVVFIFYITISIYNKNFIALFKRGLHLEGDFTVWTLQKKELKLCSKILEVGDIAPNGDTVIYTRTPTGYRTANGDIYFRVWEQDNHYFWGNELIVCIKDKSEMDTLFHMNNIDSRYL
ncbi:MAG: hypothetical protein FWH35_00700 [Treponema sp.]|nr:hypothetical protein [Treponema sp.]